MKMYGRLLSGILLVQVRAFSAVNEPPAKSSPHLCPPPTVAGDLNEKNHTFQP